jgi:hypothetical protein
MPSSRFGASSHDRPDNDARRYAVAGIPCSATNGKPYVYHAYVGHGRPERTCGHDHRHSWEAEECVDKLAQRLNRAASYRLAVRDGGELFHYDRADYPAAYGAWVLLRDHGRDGVTAWIEQREGDAEWRALEGRYPVPKG